MSQIQLTKIISELNKNNDKLMILALMQVPSLKPDADYEGNDLKTLSQLISENVLSNNPDVSYLSRKAANHMQDKFQLVPVDESVILGASADSSDEFITIDESFSQDPLTLEKQLLGLPDNYLDHDNILPFLMHTNNRIIATCIETLARTSYPQPELISETKVFLDSDNNRIKANAIIAIGSIDFSMVTDHLAAMFQTTKISMRESAVYAISMLQPSAPLQKLLLKCLHDPYLDIRLRAIEILKQYNHPDVVTQMKRLANDLDIEICEAALETIQYLETSDTSDVNLVVPDEQPLAPFEHIQTFEESHDPNSMEDIDPVQDDFFNSAEEESIHIENDFISIENNELDEFIIPAKPNQDEPHAMPDINEAKIESAISSFETPIDDFDNFEMEESPQPDDNPIDQHNIEENLDEEVQEAVEDIVFEQPEPIQESVSDIDPEYDLFAGGDTTQEESSDSDSFDLFAVDDTIEVTPQSIEEPQALPLEEGNSETQVTSDFDVFDDIEPSESFSAEQVKESPVIEKPLNDTIAVEDEFDLFDLDSSPSSPIAEPSSETIEETQVLSDESSLDEFPDFEEEPSQIIANSEPQEISDVTTDNNTDFDDFADFPEFDQQANVEASDSPLEPAEPLLEPASSVITNTTIEVEDHIEPEILEVVAEAPVMSDETLKSLEFLDVIHQKFFKCSQSLEIDSSAYFQDYHLKISDDLFSDYVSKDLNILDNDWLPYVKVKQSKQKSVTNIPIERVKPEPKKVATTKPKPIVKTAKPANKEQISLKISIVLKEIGNQCYQLCQEYEPDNEEINNVYKTILKIQSHLDAMINGKIKPTVKLNLKVIKRKLDQTFEKLGRVTLKEINNKKFILHNSEHFQKQIRMLVKQLNS